MENKFTTPPPFNHIEYEIDHGMEQGLIPRFYLQMLSLSATHPFFEEKLEFILNSLMPEIKSFYDKYNSIVSKVSEYKTGIENGTYFKITDKGTTSIDRKLEIEINDISKDFFSKGKLIYRLFFESDFVKQDGFDLQKFAFGTGDFERKKNEYIKSPDVSFLPVIKLLEEANKSFLADLNNFRNKSQKEAFKFDKFPIIKTENGVTVTEPLLNGKPLTHTISNIYHGLLNLVEEVMALLIGIYMKNLTNGVMVTYENQNYDYTKQIYRFASAMLGSVTSENCWPIV
jgi:hypothetical protein